MEEISLLSVCRQLRHESHLPLSPFTTSQLCSFPYHPCFSTRISLRCIYKIFGLYFFPSVLFQQHKHTYCLSPLSYTIPPLPSHFFLFGSSKSRHSSHPHPSTLLSQTIPDVSCTPSCQRCLADGPRKQRPRRPPTRPRAQSFFLH